MSIFAAQHEDGTVTLMVVNRGDADVTVPLRIDHYVGEKTAVLHRFDATHKAENLGKVAVDELKLPGQSISLYVLSNKA